MLQEFHSSPQGGHSGFLRTYKRIAANVYWPGMKGMIQEFVKSCVTCQQHKYLASSPGGLLQPLPILETEVVNRCLETYLRCFAADQPKTWVTWIPWAEYWLNTTFPSATQQTPFEVVYGRKPPTMVRWGIGDTRVEAVQRELQDRDEAMRQLREQLLKAQNRMKAQADTHRIDRSFEVGEWVFVKIRAHRQ
ncbi:hypothetical protein KIW84_070446 [Lathyrus oleraceus]|uniref:Integrase zinc-binding domain-containing protein n=1 Tax=Pisum sativum TaxID=3888 RepID=A0A9D4ZTM4_PEA|nr:hypothetical protein KIW84_070446 [Pisum sativum]